MNKLSEKTLNSRGSASAVALEGFRNDVLNGLSQNPKRLYSKYFYDAAGDSLFQQIMAMPEYYLTQCELDIFQNRTKDLAEIITAKEGAFDLIELGAGDATKSSFLLRYLVDQKSVFSYMPIDISGNILNVLNQKLKKEIPQLNVTCLEGEYFDMLERATSLSARRKVVLFLGANIGNMERHEAFEFSVRLRQQLNPGDIVLMGFDLKKNPKTILEAYNDTAGITAAFNLNLLSRINKELKGDFNLKKFEHFQTYDPLSGACRSYLVSKDNQEVTVGEKYFHFAKDEIIYMELSQKYALNESEELARNSGFAPAYHILDSRNWFTDVIWLAC